MKSLINKKWLCVLPFVFSVASVMAEERDTAQTPVSFFDCCRPDGHAPIGVVASHLHLKGKWTISYSYMDMQMKGNRIGTGDVSNETVFQNYMMDPSEMTMQMHMLMAMYGLSNHLTVMGMMNFVSNSMSMSMMPMSEMQMQGMSMDVMNMPTSSKTSGIGDSKIYFLYKLMENCRQRIILGAGINIPSGSITENGFTMLGDNKRLPYMMQLGTGTWDILPSISYVGQNNIISWGAEAGANIKPANNSEGYSFGNSMNATAWLSYRFIQCSSVSIRMEGISTEKITGYDPSISLVNTVYTFPYADPSADAANYGGKQANLYFGINFFKPRQPIRGLRFLFEYGIPVYQNLNGLQMCLQNTILIGTQYTF